MTVSEVAVASAPTDSTLNAHAPLTDATNRVSSSRTPAKVTTQSHTRLVDWFKQRITVHTLTGKQLDGDAAGLEALWTDKVNETVLEFVTNIQHTKLILYMDSQSSLHCTYTDTVQYSQHKRPAAIQYFIKISTSKPIAITANNIHQQLQYGCITDTSTQTLHTLMSALYVPLYTQCTWPATIKKNVNKELYKFMNHLLDVTNSNNNYTVLYLPNDIEYRFTEPDDSQSVNTLCADKDLMQRLEGILIHWTRQIKEVIANGEHHNYSTNNNNNADTSTTQSYTTDTSGPLDEIQFWQNRSTDLNNLKSQLDRPIVGKLVHILRCTHSSYLAPFERLSELITHGSSEAQNNLKLLTLLQPVASRLSECRPDEIPGILPQICNTIRLISSVSTYYNTHDRICSLLRKVSNQVIIQCIKCLDMIKLLTGDVEASLALLQQCIVCSERWHSVFSRVKHSIAVDVHSAVKWEFDESKYGIFAQIDAFIQRCSNLIEICEGQLQFCYKQRFIRQAAALAPVHTRNNSLVDSDDFVDDEKSTGVSNAIPVFGGSKGGEIETILTDVEQSFTKQIHKLLSVQYNILSVKQSEWSAEFTAFQNVIKEYDIILQSTLNTLFESVYPMSLDQCISVLQSYHMIAVRANLKQLIQRKADECIALYGRNVKAVKTMFEREKKVPTLVQYQSRYSGSVQWAKSLLHRLSHEYSTVIQLQHIGVSITVLAELKQGYIQLYNNINDYIKQQHNDWLDEISTVEQQCPLTDRLNRSLLLRVVPAHQQRERVQYTFLECNFDTYLLQLFGEVRQWNKFHHAYSIPHQSSEMYSLQADQLRVLNEYMNGIVRQYNTILALLTDNERRLFHGLIKACDVKILPGVTKLNWHERFLKDWYYSKIHVLNCRLAYVVSVYKSTNSYIEQLCAELAETQLLHIVKNKIYDVAEFLAEQSEFEHIVRAKLINIYDQIVDKLQLLCTYFTTTHTTDFSTHWTAYVQQLDTKIEQSLKQCIRQTLVTFYGYLNVQSGKTDITNIYNLYVKLNDATGKIEYTPSVNELQSIVKQVSKQCIGIVQCVTRLSTVHFNTTHAGSSVGGGHEAGSQVVAADKATNGMMITTPVKSYYDVISNDTDILKLLVNLIQSSATVTVDLQRILTHYDRYSPLWSTDKTAYMRRYAATKRPLSSYEMDLARYKNTIADVSSEDQYHSIAFIRVDCTQLKLTLIQHCYIWQTKLTTLLYSNAQNELNALVELFRVNNNGVAAADTVKRVDVLQQTFKLLDAYDCVVDDEYKEELDRLVQLIDAANAASSTVSAQA